MSEVAHFVGGGSSNDKSQISVGGNTSTALVSFGFRNAGSGFGYIANASDTEIITIDGGNERVGIGTTSPSGKLDVVGSLVTTSVLDTGSLSLIGTDTTASAQTVLTLSTGVGNATGPNIVLSKSRNQSFGATVANDALGTIQFQGGNGTASVEGASISAIARDTFSGTSRASDLLFSTTPTGSTTIAERMRISQYGDIFISPRATSASSGSGILYFKNVDDTSATINGASIRTVDSSSNPSGADMRIQIASDAGTLFDAVTLDANGFLGISTTSPQVALDVVGAAKFTGAAAYISTTGNITISSSSSSCLLYTSDAADE